MVELDLANWGVGPLYFGLFDEAISSSVIDLSAFFWTAQMIRAFPKVVKPESSQAFQEPSYIFVHFSLG